VARDAGSLTFWGDGMLSILRHVARGEASAEDLLNLERKLNETQTGVDETIQNLREARHCLNASSKEIDMAMMIDRIVYGPVGKKVICGRIRELLSDSDPGRRQPAEAGCTDIEQFNNDIRELYAAAERN
jgi:hypothetical protein